MLLEEAEDGPRDVESVIPLALRNGSGPAPNPDLEDKAEGSEGGGGVLWVGSLPGPLLGVLQAQAPEPLPLLPTKVPFWSAVSSSNWLTMKASR